MQRELRDHPPRRREQVGHRAQVHEDHVAGNADAALWLANIDPPLHDAREQVMGALVGCECIARRDGLCEQQLHVRHRSSLGRLGAVGHPAHLVGMYECSRAIEVVEGRDELIEARRGRWCLARPTREAHAMAEAPRQREDVNRARSAHLGERDRHRCVELSQIGSHVLATEQLVHDGASTVEQLLGQLAHDHHPVGDSLARVRLGQLVETLDALRRKEEQGALRRAFDDERVTVGGPCRSDCGNRVLELLVPWQRCGGHRRHGVDRRQHVVHGVVHIVHGSRVGCRRQYAPSRGAMIDTFGHA